MPPIDQAVITVWVGAVAATYGRRTGDINYIFVDDEEILRVNRQFLQHDYYTDIITFDNSSSSKFISGDLFISLDTVRTNAEGLGLPYEQELHRVVIHGILHLCGLNDKGPGERELMEAAENRALAEKLNATAPENLAKAMKEGRDPTWRENLGDFGEQALYAMPVGRAAGAVTGAARVLPGAARGAVKVLSNVAAQGAAPLAVSAMDDAMGNRDFDWTDVGIGTATNLGVNKGLARLLGPAYQLAMGKVRGRMPESVVRFLEGGEPAETKAKNLVQEAYDKLKKHYAESNEDYLRKIARGEATNRLSDEELKRYTNIAHLGDYVKEYRGLIQDQMGNLLKGETPMAGKKGVASLIGKDPTWQIDLETAQNQKKSFDRMLEDLLFSTVGSEEATAAIAKDPILSSLFYRPTKREIANDLAGDMIQTYAVNKMGSDKDASIIGAAVPGGLNVKEIRKEQAKEREQKRQAGAAKVLGSWAGQQQGLTKEDQDFLDLIARKPEVIQGYGEGNSPRFRNWYLLRGQDLLRESGSDLFRPAFTTEH